MGKPRDLANLISTGNPLADGAIAVSEISDLTATAAELNIMDGVTATAAELNKMDGVTVSASDINSVTAKAPTASPTFTGTVTIGGTTYPTSDGSAGQVLTTNGSGAVSFSDPAGGGGQFDAVASGAISNGDLVVLNSNGTISTHQGFMSDQVNITGNVDTRVVGGAFDSSNNKVVIAYNDNSTDKGMAVVGTVSGTSISFGTPVEFYGTPINYTTVLFDTNSNKIVIAYQGLSSYLYAVVGTVSGTSISFGSVATLYSAAITWLAGCFDSNVNKCAFFYRNHANQGTGLVATVSGTSITGGTGVDMLNGGVSFNINNTGANFDSSNNKCVAAFRNATDSNKGYAIVADVSSSGNTLTFGQPVKFRDSTITGAEVGFDSNVNKCLITYRDTSDNFHKARVGTVSGSGSSSTISYGTEVTIHSTSSDSSTNNRRIAFDSNINKFVFIYTDAISNDKRVILGTISGTDVSFGDPQIYDATNTTHQTVVFDTNANKSVVFAIESSTGSNIGFGKVLFNDYGESFFKWVGIAQAAVSNGATGTVTVLGGVSENQSSLTVGSAHYLKNDGTLSTTIESGREIGKAISATKLLLTSSTIT